MAVVEFVQQLLSIPEDFHWLAMCMHISVSGPFKEVKQLLIFPFGVKYTINSLIFEVFHGPRKRFVQWIP